MAFGLVVLCAAVVAVGVAMHVVGISMAMGEIPGKISVSSGLLAFNGFVLIAIGLAGVLVVYPSMRCRDDGTGGECSETSKRLEDI